MREKSARLKYEIQRREHTVTSVAQELGCRREELSMVIHGTRHYPSIRMALADFLSLPLNSRLLAYTPKRAAQPEAV